MTLSADRRKSKNKWKRNFNSNRRKTSASNVRRPKKLSVKLVTKNDSARKKIERSRSNKKQSKKRLSEKRNEEKRKSSNKKKSNKRFKKKLPAKQRS